MAKRFDLKYGRVGHLFQSRYRYNVSESATSQLVVARYIHLNPVEAGLVRHTEDWPYSDYGTWVALANSDEGRLLQEFLPHDPCDYVAVVRSAHV